MPQPRSGLGLARAAFLLPAGVYVGLLLLLAPDNLRMVQFDWRVQDTYPVVASMVSLADYALFTLTIRYAVALVCVLVGVGIAWRKADDRVAWLAGVTLVSLPIVFQLGGSSATSDFYPLPWRQTLQTVYEVLALASLQACVLFVLLFPNGRMPARWLGWAYGVFTLINIGLSILLAMNPDSNFFAPWLVSLVTNLWLGLAGQFYRYRRLSTALERQQTKWVVVGLTLFGTVMVVSIILQIATGGGPYAGVVLLVMNLLEVLSLGLVPVTLAFSILRYRLWDIDRLIHRTLLYAVLTSALAGLYLGSVIVLQATLRAATGQAQSPVVTVLSTLFIAAVAGPLRTRVQRGIDRRFNRRRYDAARTLEAFSAALRDDAHADLDRLNAQLIGVVQDTLEPEKVSLWLRS